MSYMIQKRAPTSGNSLRTVLSDGTYSQIRELLLSHQIAPGERVNIDALARELDVSQTPVRESLARLEADGLVAKEPLRGYKATDLLTVAQVQDLFQFRELIEPWAAMKAARSIDEQGHQRIRQELLTGKSAEKLGIDEAYPAMSKHDARFHALIAELSRSEFVRDAYIHTHCHLHLFRLYKVQKTWLDESQADAIGVRELFDLYYNPSSGFLALREHERIAEAVIGGDEVRASSLMLEHIENSLSRFTPTISNPEPNQ